MASKLIVLVTVLAACNAAPLVYSGPPLVYPIYRIARSQPSFAYGFGSGFSSNIGGISHSSGIGASFQSGDAQAYGSGIGSSDGSYAQGVGVANTGRGVISNEGSYAQGVGIANTGRGNRVQPTYTSYQPTYTNYQPQNNYGTSYSLAHNDGNSGTAISATQNLRDRGYATAISSGNGYGQTAVSSAQTNGNGYAVSAAQNVGGFGAGTAHAIQHRGNGFQQTSATSIVQPSIQLAQSQAFNTGYY